MLNLDCTILNAVVDQAMTAAADHPRWLNAINRAVVEVLSNPYMHRDTDHGGLILVSSTSGELYTSNGTCQCPAFVHGQPCWHRAAARLVRRHDEEQAKAAQRPARYCFFHPDSTDHDTQHCPNIEEQTDRAAIIARQRAAEAALLECWS